MGCAVQGHPRWTNHSGEFYYLFIYLSRGDSIHANHQMGNIEIRLIIFSAAKDGEALYSQQKQDLELTAVLIISFS